MSQQKEKYVKAAYPTVSSETLHQFVNLQNYIDNSLMNLISKNFSNNEEKNEQLLLIINHIRDFLFKTVTENSLRIALINKFKEIDDAQIQKKEVNTQEAQALSENNYQKIKENPELDPPALEKRGTVGEDTSNSQSW